MPDYANLAKAVRKRKSKKFPKPETMRQRIGADDARAYRKRKVKANKMTAEMKRRMEKDRKAKVASLNSRIREQQGDKPY